MSLRSTARGRVTGTLAMTVVASVLAWRGCGAEPESTPGTTAPQADAGADVADARSEAARDADASADTGADADAQMDAADVDVGKDALPDAVPPGWEEYTGWSAECPLYIPGPGAEMPPPIEWEPCPAPVPQELGCRRMKTFWNPGPGGVGGFAAFAPDVNTGAPLLFFTRWWIGGDTNVAYRMVAEVDGSVRTAFLQLNADERNGNGEFKCWMATEAMTDNRFLLRIIQQDGSTTTEGVVAGDIDAHSAWTVLKLPVTTMFTSSWAVSADWIVQVYGGTKAWTWDLATTNTVYDSSQDPDGLPGYVPVVHHKDVFTPLMTLGMCGIMAWNPTVGLQPLLRWHGDSTRGAGTFGTDGVDMVWTYAEGANACDTDPPNPEVWTAPYTLDPVEAQSTARRVRSDVRGKSPERFVVGFGYAARGSAFGSPPANNLFVVRLSDGVSWVLEGDPNGDAINWGPTLLGMTQDEVFLRGSMKGSGPAIFRIRLDSLGPGTPPD